MHLFVRIDSYIVLWMFILHSNNQFRLKDSYIIVWTLIEHSLNRQTRKNSFVTVYPFNLLPSSYTSHWIHPIDSVFTISYARHILWIHDIFQNIFDIFFCIEISDLLAYTILFIYTTCKIITYFRVWFPPPPSWSWARRLASTAPWTSSPGGRRRTRRSTIATATDSIAWLTPHHHTADIIHRWGGYLRPFLWNIPLMIDKFTL